jgi:hypothetical protein
MAYLAVRGPSIKAADEGKCKRLVSVLWFILFMVVCHRV